MPRLLKFFRSPASTRRLLFACWVRLLWTSARLRLISPAEGQKLLSADLPSRARKSVDRDHNYSAEQICSAIATAARYVPKATCLVQALVAREMLTASGRQVQVRIGVANGADAGFEAHAWVEGEGKILIGGDVDRYTPLPHVTSR
jgi:hypothetical protein